MDVRDLRIGNYVFIDRSLCEVITLDVKAEGNIEVRTMDEQRKTIKHAQCLIEPIPITREMVTRCCGFDINGRLRIDVNVYLCFLKEKRGHVILLDANSVPVIHFWDVRGLHQLQNLHYILKGEELKVSLNNYFEQLKH